MSNVEGFRGSRREAPIAAPSDRRGRLHAVRSGTDQAKRKNGERDPRRGVNTDDAGPMRTCVGCRRRDLSSRLVRVVAPIEPETTRVRPLPDGDHRLPGRGAWVHPTVQCLDLAERRSSFVRALRLSGPVDVDLVRTYIESLSR